MLLFYSVYFGILPQMLQANSVMTSVMPHITLAQTESQAKNEDHIWSCCIVNSFVIIYVDMLFYNSVELKLLVYKLISQLTWKLFDNQRMRMADNHMEKVSIFSHSVKCVLPEKFTIKGFFY